MFQRSWKTLLCAGAAISLAASAGASSAGTFTYEYDALGRLTLVQYPDGSQVSYTYDPAGNRTRLVAVKGGGGNRPPVAAADVASTSLGVPITINPLANDSDPDGDALIIQSVTSVNAAISTDQRSITYTPASGFTGQDVFQYTVSDGRGGTASASITVTVGAANRNPVAVNDSALTNTNTAAVVNVLANDSDPDGDPISVSAATQPSHGTTTFTGSAVTYQPSPGYGGPDSFGYSISDGRGGVANATVNVSVNRPPIVGNDSTIVTENMGNYPIGVLANDSDPDGDPITISSVTQPSHGSVYVFGNHTIYYTPATNYVGPDSFTYTVSDGRGGFTTGVVSVSVQVNNVPPTANPDVASTSVNTPVTINVLANDTDYDGNPLSVTGVGTPGEGTASFTSSSVIYTPRSGFAGHDTFTYTIQDIHGASSSSTVSVSVVAPTPTLQAVNDTLTAYNYLIYELGWYVHGCISPMGNDVLPLGTAQIVGVTQPPVGTVTIEGDQVCFMAGDYMSGAHGTFIYYISDGVNPASGATVYINVVPDGG